jgi:hypothetical protein
MNEVKRADGGAADLEQVRRLAEGILGHPIEEYQWQGLVKQRYPVPDYDGRDRDAALQEAVQATVQAWQDLYSAVRPSVERLPLPPRAGDVPRLEALRGLALSALYAADARRDKGVLEFRREILHDRLLPADDSFDAECHAWIQGHEQGWMFMGRLLSVQFVADDPSDEKGYDMPWTLRILHEITERLGKRYDWTKYGATRFVLSDWTPPVHPLRAHGRIPYAWISASRITLVVDPAVSPEHVAEFYQRIRKSDSYYAGAQVRPLGEKALLLAAFSASTNDGEPAIDQVHKWNVLHPGHAYDETNPGSVSNFRRDMKQARDRLLHPKLGHEGTRDAQKAAEKK